MTNIDILDRIWGKMSNSGNSRVDKEKKYSIYKILNLFHLK